MLKSCVLALIRLYQRISRFWPRRCRFVPTCSTYSYQAFETLGLIRGSILTFNRLCRCHPFHPGGLDPVPPSSPSSSFSHH